ncbi:hypothetical protein [Moorena bouillonii]|nr:hypothetical protein [Moorena bouillonii]
MGRWGDGESEVVGSREREGSVGGVGRWGDGEMGIQDCLRTAIIIQNLLI